MVIEDVIMQQQVNAEVVVLDRIMYLLEENSVNHLTSQDEKFRTFIQDLYQTIGAHSDRLRAITT